MKDFRRTREWANARRMALRLTDGICYLCGRPVDTTLKQGPWAPRVDHRIPAARGGALYDQENLAVTHKLCNEIKGTSSAEGLAMRRAVAMAAAAQEEIVAPVVDFLSEEEGDEEDAQA